MNGNLVTIVKDGKLTNVDAAVLHEGDLVVVQTGDIVPADLHLVEERGLVVDDFDITGEIWPVHKQINDQAINVYMGSKVVKGAGKGVVMAAGEESEYGKILKQEHGLILPHPIQVFHARYLFLAALLLPALAIHLVQSPVDFWLAAFYVPGFFVLILLQNDPLFRRVLVHREIQRLSRLGIQIRAPEVFERLWNLDILCFDKTGVLTTRGLRVKQLYLVDKGVDAEGKVEEQIGEDGLHELITACALCHDVLFYEKISRANPVDQALIAFAEKQGCVLPELWSQCERIYDMPFESENRLMMCGYRQAGRVVYYVKGDPDAVLHLCKDYLTAAGQRKKVDAPFWNCNVSAVEAISQKGDMAIAFACASALSDQAETPFTFLGLVQLENSLRPGVREVVQNLTMKGIRVLLLTGDRRKTAVSVGQVCGISAGSQACLTGQVMDAIGSQEVARQAQYCSVFARLVPSQKGYLIRILQQGGHCVGMVGDGANDGTALRLADVSISFIKNSSLIARQFANILLPELVDLLALMEGALQTQRRLKILKVFRYLILAAALVGAYLGTLSGLW